MCIKANEWILLDDVSWFPRGEQKPKGIFYLKSSRDTCDAERMWEDQLMWAENLHF